MSEYCEYMWSLSRTSSSELARSLYLEKGRRDVKDKKLAIRTVRAILRGMNNIDLVPCTDEYITRFLLARKYQTDQAAALIGSYQAQIAHRQDIFGNLTARDPALQRALRAGIPGVLPARDKKGRCVLVILASQWDPIAVPALSVQRAIFLVLETLIQDPRNQTCGFVAVVDWNGFSLRQGGALGAAAVRQLVVTLRGRFPARFKAIHFLQAPLYVQATLTLVKPFLDEKTRHKIYLHGNNLSTLHEHLPTDILPADFGGTGPAFNPGLWAEPVIHSAMKEAELAAIERDKGHADKPVQNQHESARTDSIVKGKQVEENGPQTGITIIDVTKSGKLVVDDENKINVDNRRIGVKENRDKILDNEERQSILDNDPRLNSYTDHEGDEKRTANFDTNCLGFSSETNSNDFELVPNRYDSEDSQDNSWLSLRTLKNPVKRHKEQLPEEANLIT